MTWRSAGVVCFVALSVLFVRQAWLYADVLRAAIHYPYGLDYGEGIVWQQAALMFTPAAYGDITTFPMIVFHYTPLFHVVSRGLAAATSGDLFISGRAVSILSTIGCGIAIAALVDSVVATGATRTRRIAVAVASALIALCLRQVVAWSVLMRVDMLAHFFSLLGLWFGIRALRVPRSVYVASLCFLLAVFTKQNAITAPAAFFGAALVLRPRVAARGLLCCALGGITTLAILAYVTDGQILRHIFLYNVNRVDLSQLHIARDVAADNLGLIASALVGGFQLAAPLWTLLRTSTRGVTARAILDSPPYSAAVVMLAYSGIATVMLIGIVKVGANYNYTIEWLLSLCVLAGSSVAMLMRDVGSREPERVIAHVRYPNVLFGPLLLVAQIMAFVQFDTAALSDPRHRGDLQALVARIRNAPVPVVSDDMVLVMRAGKRVEIEPAIAAELASVGRWDERIYIQRIQRHDFAMFITEQQRGDKAFDSRYNPAVADAMAHAYPVIEHVGSLTLHLPAHRLARDAP